MKEEISLATLFYQSQANLQTSYTCTTLRYVNTMTELMNQIRNDRERTASTSSIIAYGIHRKRKQAKYSIRCQQRLRLVYEENLCSQCSTLDLAKALRLYEDMAAQSDRPRGLKFGDVGLRYRQPPGTDCRLCLMLHASRINPNSCGTFGHADSADEGDILWLYSLLDNSNVHNITSSAHHSVKVANDSLCLAVVPRTFDRNSFDVQEHRTFTSHCQRTGHAVIAFNTSKGKMFAPQIIPSSFNASLVQEWLSYCNCNHGSICRSLVNWPLDLQLIDCYSLFIVDIIQHKPYVALSYMWGRSDGVVETQRPNKRKLCPSNVPLVILDAITVTKKLGFKYLWVDRYCTEQDNAAIKHAQMQQMDNIYQASMLTIIAAAGVDDTYGLPGVSTRARKTQPVANVGGAQVIGTMQDPHSSIRSSRWSTRGWTFQEALLSRRRLVFTDEQMYFECNAMNCYESIHTPLDDLHIKDKTKIRDSIRAGVFGRNDRQVYGKLVPHNLGLATTFARYLTTVEEFSRRELTHERDSLYAFQGVLKHFARHDNPMLNMWGIAFPKTSTAALKSTYFVDALTWCHSRGCWDHGKPPKRRSEFPSWSWAGWAGDAEYINRTDYHKKNWFESEVQSIRFETMDGRQMALPFMGRNELGLEPFKLLHVSAMVVPHSLISFREERMAKTKWAICSIAADLYLSDGPETESKFFEALETRNDWKCVLVGQSLSTIYIMVLKVDYKASGTMSRAGVFVVKHFWCKDFMKILIDNDAIKIDCRIE